MIKNVLSIFIIACMAMPLTAQKGDRSNNTATETSKTPATTGKLPTGDKKPDATAETIKPEQGNDSNGGKKPRNVEEAAPVGGKEPILEAVGNNGGTINWTEQYIEAQGVCIVDYEKYKNKRQAEEMAKRGAMIIAQANLLEVMEGVRIVRETTVKDMMTESDVLQARVEGTIKGAKKVGDVVINDGAAEVTMRLSLTEVAKTAKSSMKKAEVGANDLTGLDDSVDATETKELADNVVLRFPEGTQLKPSVFPVIVDDNGGATIDLSKYYDPIKGKLPRWINLAGDIAEVAGVNKTIVDAVQDFDGSIHINTDTLIPDSKPKIKKWLKVAGKVGKFLLDVLL